MKNMPSKCKELEYLEAKLEAIEKLLEAIMDKCVELEQMISEVSTLVQLKDE